MNTVFLSPHASLSDWREQARNCLQLQIAPHQINWCVSETDTGLGSQCSLNLFAEANRPSPESTADQKVRLIAVPKAFMNLAGQVICHRSPGRFALLYQVLWRITHGERHLLAIAVDPQIRKLMDMAKSVRRDQHKMKAFLRFKLLCEPGVSSRKRCHRELFNKDETAHDDSSAIYVAWFEPEHFIVDSLANFFTRRFTGMNWSIVTPYRSMHWDQQKLSFGRGMSKSEVPNRDRMDELWRAYYASIFNPARLNLKAMQAEMPKKYWKNLPEADLISSLASSAARNTERMVETAAIRPEDHRRRVHFDRDKWLSQKKASSTRQQNLCRSVDNR